MKTHQCQEAPSPREVGSGNSRASAIGHQMRRSKGGRGEEREGEAVTEAEADAKQMAMAEAEREAMVEWERERGLRFGRSLVLSPPPFLRTHGMDE